VEFPQRAFNNTRAIKRKIQVRSEVPRRGLLPGFQGNDEALPSMAFVSFVFSALHILAVENFVLISPHL
jgi:hypothetical protein